MKRIIITAIVTLALTAFAVHAVQTAFSGAGVIESTTGGFKFPDGSVQLSAVTPPCTAITYLPYTITVEGVYCFTGHLETSMTSGNAITIEADNVVIDLNGWKLDGLGAGLATAAIGIYANQRKNITIRNGTIRRFDAGIQIDGVYDFDADSFSISQGHLIEDIRADANAVYGIGLAGNGNIVRNNQIVNTLANGFTSSSGIIFAGPGGRILNNDINQISSLFNSTYAISISSADNTVAKNNRISDVSTTTGTTTGIAIINSSDVLAVGNSITNADNGIEYVGATGKYMDNLTSGVTTPFTGGTAVGTND